MGVMSDADQEFRIENIVIADLDVVDSHRIHMMDVNSIMDLKSRHS